MYGFVRRVRGFLLEFVYVQCVGRFRRVYRCPFRFGDFFTFSSAIIAANDAVGMVRLAGRVVGEVVVFFGMGGTLVSVHASGP